MIVRRGRPGLLGTMARTAVVAGTATAVTGGMRRRQAAREEDAAQQAYDEQQQQAAMQARMPQYAQPGTDMVGEIQKLAELRAAGALTDEEFATAKTKLLA